MGDVYKILTRLEATPGRNDKIAILTKNKEDLVLMNVVRMALDPFTLFYIKKIPKYTQSNKGVIDLDHALSQLLDKIASRNLTGNAAIDFVRDELLSRLSQNDAEVLERVILKDLSCGVQESTANKVWDKLIPTYPCMLASGFEQKLVDKIVFPAIAQCKMDGMRFNAIVNANTQTVEFRSRNGKLIDIKDQVFPQAFLEMARNIGMARVVFDGELLVVDESGKLMNRQEGNGILNKAVKGTISETQSAQIRACIWDVIPFAYFTQEKCHVGYEDRLVTVVTAVDNLSGAFKHLVHVVETNIANSEREARKLFEQYYAAGQEGIILKSRNGIWENKRAKHQIKYKGELEADLLCVDWIPGTGKYKNMLGSLVLKSADGKVNVSVGTGFSDGMRGAIKKEDVVDKIIAVKYNSLIEDVNGEHSLFLPVFIEIREDKKKADSLKDMK